MKKTILCDESQKEYLFEKEAVKTMDGIAAVRNIETISLASLMHDPHESVHLEILMLARTLHQERDAFPLYGDMFSYPAFFEEILSFARQCVLFQIDPDNLPERNDHEKELKKIVKAAMAMDLGEKHINRDELIQKISSLKDIWILDGFETDYYRWKLVQDLPVRKHISWQSEKKPVFYLRHALNTAKEIEAAAQHIIAHPQPCSVILADKGQLPLLKAVFSRYGISWSCMLERSPSRIFSIYASLVQYALHPDKEHLFKCIDNNAFGPACPPDIRNFLFQTMTSSAYPEGVLRRFNNSLFNGGISWDSRSVRSIDQTERRASAWFHLIEKKIHLLEETDLPEYPQLAEPAIPFVKAYELIRSSSIYEKEEEYGAARRIGEDLKAVLPFIKKEEDALIYADMLDSGSVSTSRFSGMQVLVSDLTHPLPAQKYAFVIGCTAAAYPALPVKKGIFDEDYVAAVDGFPALEERSSAYRTQLAWIAHAAEVIYWSYPTNDFDGKNIEPSFEVTSFFDRNDDRLWPIDEGSWQLENTHVIENEELKKKLFLQRERRGGPEIIYGSVSKVQTWFNCPYKYFLQYGMRMNVPSLPDLDGNTIGNIQHEILETIVHKHGKKYAAELEDADRLTAPFFAALREIIPVRQYEIELAERRMNDNLKHKAMCFADYENDSTSFIPKEEEAAFEHVHISPHVSIQGSIDRIDVDAAHHLFRIIDYKTSSLDLSEDDIKAGLSLQLLSYLAAACEDEEMQSSIGRSEPAGMMYYPLVTSRNSAGQAKGGNFRDEKTRYQMMIKANAIHGWSFIDAPELLDEDMKHITSIRTQHDYAKARLLLEEVYEAFYTNLFTREGTISRPVKQGMGKACMFCHFKTICRYRGDGYEPQLYSNITTSEKKGRNNEN